MEHMSTKNWALNNITDTIPKLEMKMVHQESKYYKQVGLLRLPPSAPNLYIAIIGGGGEGGTAPIISGTSENRGP